LIADAVIAGYIHDISRRHAALAPRTSEPRVRIAG
jgi:hypothetical protein